MDAHRPAINEEPLIVPPNSAVDDGPEHYESDDTLMGGKRYLNKYLVLTTNAGQMAMK